MAQYTVHGRAQVETFHHFVGLTKTEQTARPIEPDASDDMDWLSASTKT